MNEKWIYVVLFDLIILSQSSPGRFRDIFKWGWGRRGHHWGGRHTTTITETTVKIATTEAQQDESMSPYPTLPQAVITDIDIRHQENDTTSILNFDPSVIQPDVLAKNETKQTFQPTVFTTGPKDETSKIKVLDTAAVSDGTIEPGGIFISSLDNGTVELGTATNTTGGLLAIGLDSGTVEPGTETNRTGGLFTSGLDNGKVETGTATNGTRTLFTSGLDSGTVEQKTATNRTGALFNSDLNNGTDETGTTTRANGTGALFTSSLDSGTTSATNRTESVLTSGLGNGTIEPGTESNQRTDTFLDGLETTVLPDGEEVLSLWHVVIYKKEAEFVDQIRVLCGGSLVKTDFVISAAHCFWSSESQELTEPEKFLVAAGKIHPQWDDRRDKKSQYAAIKNITIAPTHPPCFQPDLAFVALATPFIFSNGVKPVCINFDEDLENQQLRKGSFGTKASWADLERLNWSSLPYVEVRVCSRNQIFITRHAGRICAGEVNDPSQSETESGNGLVFYQNEIPYLRGVASINPENRFCFKYNTRSFTNIGAAKDKAEGLIKDIFNNLSNTGCEEFYKKSVTFDRTASPNETVSQGEEEIEEDSLVFSGASIGSWPVPTLPETSAPAFQWHVGVYSKAWTPYMQICGGSLVKRDFVISAAHCFWDDAAGQQPAAQFAVAGGKLYRPWNDTQDVYAQLSNVSEIILPVRFRGRATSFQDDIAILRLTSPFTYAPGVQSVCVDFNLQFDREQLQPGNIGTVAGWGLTKDNGRPSQRLNYLELPLMDVAGCFSASDPSFHKYITSDKVCAGDRFSGRALCRGDSGGGLVVLSDFADTTPYLRGIASTAPPDKNLCNAFSIAAFTQIYAHRTLLRDNIPDIDEECADLPGKNRERVNHVGTINVRDVKDVENKGSLGTNGVDVTRNVGAEIGERTQFAAPNGYPNAPFHHFVCNCNCK